jgi:hypothetical protein
VPVRRTLRRGVATWTAGTTISLVLGATPAVAMPAADQEMPFPCGQEWYGSTRSGHSPSWFSIDWNGPEDLGKPIVASAPGVVSRVENLGSRSYGLYVILDHGNGETTLYAHLQAEYVAVGQRVDQGELLGRLGESGGVTGAHLHYEQRQDGRGEQPYFHDQAFTFNSSLVSRTCVDTPVAGDWDGDGDDEVGVFRRGRVGSFRLAAADGVRSAVWGSALEQPVIGDWDGDGMPDLGVREPVSGQFSLQGADGPLPPVTFGQVGDRPVSGDWDADGVTDLGVWRPVGASFLLRASDGSAQKVPLGTTGSLPVTGDWNGDGRTDLGTFAAGTWTLHATRADGTTSSSTLTLGKAGDLPVSGDWNGDGADDLGVWNPSTAVFTLRDAAPMSRRTTSLVTQRFGRPR